MSDRLDVGFLQQWIGRREQAEDLITPRLAASLRATLDLPSAPCADGDPAPLCAHWCLAPAIVAESETGADGHPARGGFLPPVPLPRRMWAGGELRFLAPLRIGDRVRRVSRIESVELKEGRSGRLCFVRVAHEITTSRGVAVEEVQDIVYRDAVETAGRRLPAPAAPSPEATLRRTVEASTLKLFRYSALTFNGHRIHYDRDYCRTVEGYPGLVVHGPLQATLLALLAQEALGRPPTRFVYRGVSALFDGAAFTVNVGTGSPLPLWSAAEDGRVTRRADAA